jgi:hypothetical protein
LPSRLGFTRWLLMLNNPGNPQKIIAIPWQTAALAAADQSSGAP